VKYPRHLQPGQELMLVGAVVGTVRNQMQERLRG
jgi:hypothetical protein